MYFKVVQQGYKFEKRIFTPFSVNEVYKLTDDDPLRLELYMEDKEATVSTDNVAFF